GHYSVVESNGICSATSPATIAVKLYGHASTITVVGTLDICTSGSVLLRGPGGAGLRYQWKKGAVNISGATNRTFTATGTGSYSLVVTTANSCSQTSAPVVVYSSCKDDNTSPSLANSHMLLYPNPTDGHFIVDLKVENDVNEKARVEVYNALG